MKVDSASAVSGYYETTAQDQKTAADADAFKTQLEAAAASQDTKSLKEACQQFEAFFVNMMFKEMRTSIGDGGLTEKSFARSTFEGMLDDEMSTKISEAGGIGIADLLYKNLMNAYNIGEMDSSDDSGTDGEAGSAATGAGLNLLG